ncbi:unnamed protein product [Amoebophrya sp. A120]|nr:unnamed protein product [Amoebophrya sp. A120]|eukprot:GSA120T00013843001.1
MLSRGDQDEILLQMAWLRSGTSRNSTLASCRFHLRVWLLRIFVWTLMMRDLVLLVVPQNEDVLQKQKMLFSSPILPPPVRALSFSVRKHTKTTTTQKEKTGAKVKTKTSVVAKKRTARSTTAPQLSSRRAAGRVVSGVSSTTTRTSSLKRILFDGRKQEKSSHSRGRFEEESAFISTRQQKFVGGEEQHQELEQHPRAIEEKSVLSEPQVVQNNRTTLLSLHSGTSASADRDDPAGLLEVEVERRTSGKNEGRREEHQTSQKNEASVDMYDYHNKYPYCPRCQVYNLVGLVDPSTGDGAGWYDTHVTDTRWSAFPVPQLDQKATWKDCGGSTGITCAETAARKTVDMCEAAGCDATFLDQVSSVADIAPPGWTGATGSVDWSGIATELQSGIGDGHKAFAVHCKPSPCYVTVQNVQQPVYNSNKAAQDKSCESHACCRAGKKKSHFPPYWCPNQSQGAAALESLFSWNFEVSKANAQEWKLWLQQYPRSTFCYYCRPGPEDPQPRWSKDDYFYDEPIPGKPFPDHRVEAFELSGMLRKIQLGEGSDSAGSVPGGTNPNGETPGGGPNENGATVTIPSDTADAEDDKDIPKCADVYARTAIDDCTAKNNYTRLENFVIDRYYSEHNTNPGDIAACATACNFGMDNCAAYSYSYDESLTKQCVLHDLDDLKAAEQTTKVWAGYVLCVKDTAIKQAPARSKTVEVEDKVESCRENDGTAADLPIVPGSTTSSNNNGFHQGSGNNAAGGPGGDGAAGSSPESGAGTGASTGTGGSAAGAAGSGGGEAETDEGGAGFFATSSSCCDSSGGSTGAADVYVPPKISVSDLADVVVDSAMQAEDKEDQEKIITAAVVPKLVEKGVEERAAQEAADEIATEFVKNVETQGENQEELMKKIDDASKLTIEDQQEENEEDEQQESDPYCVVAVICSLVGLLLLIGIVFCLLRSKESTAKEQRRREVNQALHQLEAESGDPKWSLSHEVVETALLTAGLTPSYAKKLARQIASTANVEDDEVLVHPENERDLVILKRMGLDFSDHNVLGAEERVGRMRGFLQAVASHAHGKSGVATATGGDDHDTTLFPNEGTAPALEVLRIDETEARLQTAGFSEKVAGFLAAKLVQKAAALQAGGTLVQLDGNVETAEVKQLEYVAAVVQGTLAQLMQELEAHPDWRALAEEGDMAKLTGLADGSTAVVEMLFKKALMKEKRRKVSATMLDLRAVALDDATAGVDLFGGTEQAGTLDGFALGRLMPPKKRFEKKLSGPLSTSGVGGATSDINTQETSQKLSSNMSGGTAATSQVAPNIPPAVLSPAVSSDELQNNDGTSPAPSSAGGSSTAGKKKAPSSGSSLSSGKKKLKRKKSGAPKKKGTKGKLASTGPVVDDALKRAEEKLLRDATAALLSIGFSDEAAAGLAHRIAGTNAVDLGSQVMTLSDGEKAIVAKGLNGVRVNDLSDLVDELVAQKPEFFQAPAPVELPGQPASPPGSGLQSGVGQPMSLLSERLVSGQPLSSMMGSGLGSGFQEVEPASASSGGSAASTKEKREKRKAKLKQKAAP